MDALSELAALEGRDSFVARHIGPGPAEIEAMLSVVGVATLDELAGKTVPAAIRATEALALPPAIDEAAVKASAAAASIASVTGTQKARASRSHHIPASVRPTARQAAGGRPSGWREGPVMSASPGCGHGPASPRSWDAGG